MKDANIFKARKNTESTWNSEQEPCWQVKSDLKIWGHKLSKHESNSEGTMFFRLFIHCLTENFTN